MAVSSIVSHHLTYKFVLSGLHYIFPSPKGEGLYDPEGDIENRGKRPQRTKSVMTDNVIKAITDIFDYEEAAGIKKKQRHTAYQIYKELAESGVYQGS